MVNCVTGDLTGLHFEDWRLQEKYSSRTSASIPQIHTRRLDSLWILRCDIWEVIRWEVELINGPVLKETVERVHWLLLS